MKRKVIVFGAGKNYLQSIGAIKSFFDIVSVTDNDSLKWGKVIAGQKIVPVDDALNSKYDLILLTPKNHKGILEQMHAKGISNSKILFEEQMFEKKEYIPFKIALIAYGGMGDFLIEENWLYHLADKFKIPDGSVDIYVEERSLFMAQNIWSDCQYIDKIVGERLGYDTLRKEREYDLVIRICIVPFIQSYDGEKLAYTNPELLDYVLRLAKYGFNNYNFGFCHATFFYKTIWKIFKNNKSKNYYSFCDVFGDLGVDENFLIPFKTKIDEDDYLTRVGIEDKLFITLNTGHNKDYVNMHSTRIWGLAKWNKLAKMLQEKYNESIVVQIGSGGHENEYIHADICLNGCTTFEEMKVLMKRACVHVDYDGGLVHVRHILKGGPSVVLFGPSRVEQHRYTENICIRKDVCPEPCEWSTEDWLTDCPKKFTTLKCMDSIKPEDVLKAVETVYPS